MIGNPNAHLSDPVSIAPTIDGPHGKAWAVDLDHARNILGVRVEDDGTVAAWIVEAPWAHPFWHSYVIVLIHLRPMPDGRSTKMYLPGATHEMWLQALDPEHPRAPAISGNGPWHPLKPSNFGAQFIEEADLTAAARIRDAVQRICNGSLNPDTDYIRQWMHLFGDNMIKGDKKTAGETRIVTQQGEVTIPPVPGPQDLN